MPSDDGGGAAVLEDVDEAAVEVPVLDPQREKPGTATASNTSRATARRTGQNRPGRG
jgi:hypothetical protein